jgi:hypothetical protein
MSPAMGRSILDEGTKILRGNVCDYAIWRKQVGLLVTIVINSTFASFVNVV